MSYSETPIQGRPSRRALHQRRRDARAQRRRKLQALAAGGLVLGVGASATLAAWTDEESGSAQFAAGEFAIESYIDGSWQGTDRVMFRSAGMYPGQSIYSNVKLRTTVMTTVDGAVTINGLDKTPGTDSLSPYLQYRAVQVDPNVTECLATHFNVSADQYVFGNSAEFVSMTGQQKSTLPKMELQANSQNTLAYCFEVQLPKDASNEAQRKKSNHEWTFHATSIAPKN